MKEEELFIERLLILIEECAEVQQASTKILRFGRDNYNPYTQIPNLQSLCDELGDLMAMLILMAATEDSNAIIDATKRKLEKLKRYSSQPVELLDAAIAEVDALAK